MSMSSLCWTQVRSCGSISSGGAFIVDTGVRGRPPDLHRLYRYRSLRFCRAAVDDLGENFRERKHRGRGGLGAHFSKVVEVFSDAAVVLPHEAANRILKAEHQYPHPEDVLLRDRIPREIAFLLLPVPKVIGVIVVHVIHGLIVGKRLTGYWT